MRVRSYLLGQHADCLLPDGRPTPAEQALPPEVIPSSLRKKSKTKVCSIRKTRLRQQLRGTRGDGRPRDETPPLGDALRFCHAFYSGRRRRVTLPPEQQTSAEEPPSHAEANSFLKLRILLEESQLCSESSCLGLQIQMPFRRFQKVLYSNAILKDIRSNCLFGTFWRISRATCS